MVEPQIPVGSRLDPDMEQILADHNIWWVILHDGRRVAWNGSKAGPMDECPVCKADPAFMPDCSDCAGRGLMLHVPFAPRPWDEVVPGLWLGGHDCQPEGSPPYGDCLPEAQFDVVVSLFNRGVHYRRSEEGEVEDVVNFNPAPGVVHFQHRMSDADLDPEHHGPLDVLASHVVDAVRHGDKVLVRCQAGLNRSALLVGLAMLKMGWRAEDAISRMREVRSPYVLFNQSFVNHLKGAEGVAAD